MRPQDLVLTPRGIRFLGRTIPCAIGRGGVSTTKREGDGATPAGVHRIMGLMARPDRVRVAGEAFPIGPGDLWSDASGAPDYNQHVRAPYGLSHERLRRADPLYDLVLVTDWNWPEAEAGRGSAIFLHIWRKPRHPTEGCIAFRRDHFRWIIERLEPENRLIVPEGLAGR
ncbi:L,D-transpeptidase [Pseudoruegeria sp. SHC-113]|uniref:L,D-transpeptidase family protein n=1 Tax=Pseudoruegeria sp. SHC-113 TaxID=2855439 RepID=UPI0021BA4E67|nr:L,D-transpeptidase family protein [Pseudoruegeria sp. SHC-113]MCT8159077.1 L,D-transpeptidase family protein [Pseudoruegeria sp. SHC-113]